MTAALEVGEWSAARRTLPPGKTRYPFYRWLVWPQGRSGRAENLVPTGIRSPDRPARSQSLYRLSYRAHRLEVNSGKTKYTVMSGDQNAGLSQYIKSDNSSFERAEDFKYLGTTLTNQNAIQEEIKSRSKSGKACCHPMQNLLSSSFKLKIQRLRYTEL